MLILIGGNQTNLSVALAIVQATAHNGDSQIEDSENLETVQMMATAGGNPMTEVEVFEAAHRMSRTGDQKIKGLVSPMDLMIDGHLIPEIH